MKDEPTKLIILRPSLIKAMIENSQKIIKDLEKRINSINEFPVSDHDAGSNAYLTLTVIVDAISKKDYDTLPEIIDDLLEAVLMNSRGNIGSAIANGFAGFFSVLNKETVDAKDLAQALEATFERAQKGFNPPEKKTVLDVMEAASKKAALEVEAGQNDPVLVLEKAIIEAKKALIETRGKFFKGRIIPTEDAGAAAFVPILEAFYKVFAENQQEGGKK